MAGTIRTITWYIRMLIGPISRSDFQGAVIGCGLIGGIFLIWGIKLIIHSVPPTAPWGQGVQTDGKVIDAAAMQRRGRGNEAKQKLVLSFTLENGSRFRTLDLGKSDKKLSLGMNVDILYKRSNPNQFIVFNQTSAEAGGMMILMSLFVLLPILTAGIHRLCGRVKEDY